MDFSVLISLIEIIILIFYLYNNCILHLDAEINIKKILLFHLHYFIFVV